MPCSSGWSKAQSVAKLFVCTLRHVGVAGVMWQVCSLQMVVKCADIGHLAAGLNIHKRWAYQLEEEFFRQVSCFVEAILTGPACPLLGVTLPRIFVLKPV